MTKCSTGAKRSRHSGESNCRFFADGHPISFGHGRACWAGNAPLLTSDHSWPSSVLSIDTIVLQEHSRLATEYDLWTCDLSEVAGHFSQEWCSKCTLNLIIQSLKTNTETSSQDERRRPMFRGSTCCSGIGMDGTHTSWRSMHPCDAHATPTSTGRNGTWIIDSRSRCLSIESVSVRQAENL